MKLNITLCQSEGTRQKTKRFETLTFENDADGRSGDMEPVLDMFYPEFMEDEK